MANQTFSVTENSDAGVVVGTIVASDVDAGDRLRYTIIGGDGASAFAVGRLTGQITVSGAQPLDFDVTGSMVLEVAVTDNAGLVQTATITINLLPDTTSPNVEFGEVALQSNATHAGVVTILFDEDVAGVTIGDLRLSRDGVPIAIDALPVQQISARQYSVDLSSVTNYDGAYVVSLNAAASAIVDLEGNPLVTGAQQSFVISTPAPRVQSVVVDDGSDQRSVVRSITVRFDSLVIIDAGAFDLRRDDGTSIETKVNIDNSTGKTVVVLTFSGPMVDVGQSLTDGQYTLTILDSHVQSARGAGVLDGDADGNAGTEHIDQFFRFFGDTDGDRDVDGQDYGRFGQRFLKRLGL